MKDGKPLAVVFDLGGVLIDWNPRHLYRKLFPGDDAGMERFLAEVCSSGWNEEQDLGRGFAEAVALLAKQHPDFADYIRAYHERWEEMLGGAYDGTVEILRRLRENGLKVYALTNWSAETLPIARRRFGFLDWFDGMVVSGEERVVKPDPRIYRILIDRYGLEPSRTVFTDDLPRNVAGAEAAGLIAILFKNPEQLGSRLRELGLPA